MRVITGTARGRKLLEPAGMEIRPTTDQVKEAVFNILQGDVEGRAVLDLFAGTGQLGIEALSRGAESCTFVDESREAVRLVPIPRDLIVSPSSRVVRALMSATQVRNCRLRCRRRTSC